MRYVTDVRAIIAGSPYNWTSDTGAGAIVSYRFVAPKDLPSRAEVEYRVNAVHSFSEAQRDAFRDAADAFEDAADLKFVETTGLAMIDIYAVSGSKWAGWANYPATYWDYTSNGSLVMDQSNVRSFASVFGQDTLLHELGHAVGLAHPHEGRFRLPERLDDQGTTVMSYNAYGGHGLRALDREALDELYGSTGANAGWTVSGDFDGWRIVGTDADDRVVGLLGTNTLRGRDGDDVLGGRERADLLIGGRGDDRLIGLGGADDLRGGPGEDTLFALFPGLEAADGAGNRLAGGAGADRLVGAGSDDVLRGGKGADRLDGGAGADLLAGGDGDDILTGGSGADRFVFGRGDRGDRDIVRDLALGTDELVFGSLGLSLSDAALASRAGGRNSVLTFDAVDFDLVLRGVDAGSLAAHYDL